MSSVDARPTEKVVPRWVLTVATGLASWAFASAVGYFLGSLVYDHDLRIIVTFCISALVAAPMGLLVLMVAGRP